MKKLSIQYQPELALEIRVESVKEIIDEAAKNPLVLDYVVQEGNDQGKYINFIFSTDNLSELWRGLSVLLLADSGALSGIRYAAIVVCEGERGWDDYKLLLHFNSAVKLDSIEL